MANPILPSWGQLKNAGKQAKAVVTPDVDVNGKTMRQPTVPLMEGRRPYLPYRGENVHGGPENGPWDNPQNYNAGTVDVEYAVENEHPHVVDVRVIKDASEQYTPFRASQTIVNGVSSQIANRARNRTSIDIFNMSATDVLYVGQDPSVSSYTGYPVPVNTKVTLTTTEQIYAVNANVDPTINIQVAMLSHFTQES